ncbi:hypothetical protein WPS_14930 [Vulcanimicrobium alpinum]|uniref:Peptidase M13 N-terminal domain-containing protein n=1 Tax=Vulcanimicrobium alpinum TaxID=3016050 RepID=A0AAN1XXT1_UNVUL|nr:hypothetical protein WPS_14930 [Vulcanimicrobium alpinum]
MLLGVTTRRPRSEICTVATDQSLRDVLGRVYVARYFPAAAKVRAQALVANLQATLADDIRTLDWMSPQTKAEAETKLAAFTKKIGYPDVWEDYAKLSVARAPMRRTSSPWRASTRRVSSRRSARRRTARAGG